MKEGKGEENEKNQSEPHIQVPEKLIKHKRRFYSGHKIAVQDECLIEQWYATFSKVWLKKETSESILCGAILDQLTTVTVPLMTHYISFVQTANEHLLKPLNHH